MKKLICALLAVAMLFSMAACGTSSGDDSADALKVGFIFLHDEQSTYDKNFMDAAKAACDAMNVEYAQKTQIPESKDCFDAAVELIEVDGCDIIFADSFGHESFLIDAAKKYPDVEFCHATGTQAHTAGLDNFHNAFASIYEGPSRSWLPSFSQDSASSELFLAYAQSGWFLCTKICFQAVSLNSH